MATRYELTISQVVCLLVFIVHTSGLSFLMHASRKGVNGNYYASTAVLLCEILKLILSLFLERLRIWRNTDLQSPETKEALLTKDDGDDDEEEGERGELGEKQIFPTKSSAHSVWKQIQMEVFVGCSQCSLALPAVLYVLQNLLQLYAISSITPAMYQAIAQLKILIASVLSVWLFKKSYSWIQWLSMYWLVFGVFLLGFSRLPMASGTIDGHLLAIKSTLNVRLAQNLHIIIGLVMACLACTLGSAASVVTEMVVKDKNASIWIRNIQLSLYSLLPATAAIIYQVYHDQNNWNPFQSFGQLAWFTVIFRALAGILTSLVLKHCDSVLKGFATSLALLLSIAIEHSWVANYNMSLTILGTFSVICSSYTYVRYPIKASQ